MKIKNKSILCTVLVVLIILSTLTIASAGTTGYFYDKSISSTNYTYVSGSTKSTTGEYGNVRITRVTGGSYAAVRAGVPGATANAYSVGIGSNISVLIPAAYRVADKFVGLYGMGMQGTFQISGSWNAN